MRKWLSQEEKQNIGTVCCNCGATEDIEYHHIVPLLLGGNDVKSNIVPLCCKCHKAAHMGQHINHYRNNSRGGRHSKSSIEKNAHVFDQYINGEIGCGWIRIELVLFFLIFPCSVSFSMNIGALYTQYHLRQCLCSRCFLFSRLGKLFHQHMSHQKAHPHYL